MGRLTGLLLLTYTLDYYRTTEGHIRNQGYLRTLLQQHTASGDHTFERARVLESHRIPSRSHHNHFMDMVLRLFTYGSCHGFFSIQQAGTISDRSQIWMGHQLTGSSAATTTH